MHDLAIRQLHPREMGLFTSQVLHMDCKQRSLREKRMLTENLIEELQPAENKKCRRSLFFPVDDLSGVSLTPPPNSKPQERSLSTIKLPVLKQRITKSDSMMEAKKEQLPLCPITPMVHNEIDSCRECVNLFSFFEEV